MWYRSGTISLTNGGTSVVGAGTSWLLNAAAGESLLAPDGRLYEIETVNSATGLTIKPAYLGATAAVQSYVIIPTQSYIRDLAAQAAALVNTYSSLANNAGAGKFGDGTVAAPGITFVGDQDTGFFRSGSNEVTFVANGVAQFKYGAAGITFLNATVTINGTALVKTDDARLSNSREWLASQVPQGEAEAGIATTDRKWSSQRVRQAIAAWWNGITNIDGKIIGETTRAAGSFTTLNATGPIYSASSIAAATSVTADTMLATKATLITDWNLALHTGDYMGADAANAPGATWYIGKSTVHNQDWVTQEVWSFVSGSEVARYRRQKANGSWQPWVHTGVWALTGVTAAGFKSSINGFAAVGGSDAQNPNPGPEYVYPGLRYAWNINNPLFSGDLWVAEARQPTGYYVNNSDLVFKSTLIGDVLRLIGSGGVVLTGSLSVTGALTTAGINEDAAGNVGLGALPSVWNPAYGQKAIHVGPVGAFSSLDASGPNKQLHLSNNAHDFVAPKYIAAGGYATDYTQYAGQHVWQTAPIGATAGDPITFTQVMTLDASGNLLVGATSGSVHTIAKNLGPTFGGIFEVKSNNGPTVIFAGGSDVGAASPATGAALYVGKENVGGRSVNVTGTVNVGGADYAEYESNNGLTIVKGDIVGFKGDGTLTTTYADAVRFGVKSTNPGYVGGDVWGSEDQVGKRPVQPVYQAPQYAGPQEPVKPVIPEDEQINDEADDAEYLEALNEYQAAQTAHTEAVAAAEDAHAETMAQYEADKQAFEDRLEAARQTVDRIAYSGKVPCNVTGATPGGYIIAVEDETGVIAGEFVADPDFGQYKRAVGRVNRILDDGRCEVAVIIH